MKGKSILIWLTCIIILVMGVSGCGSDKEVKQTQPNQQNQQQNNIYAVPQNSQAPASGNSSTPYNVTPANKQTCVKCKGSGLQTCAACNGTGIMGTRTHTVYGGATYQEQIRCSCTNGKVRCTYCGGSGYR